MNKRKISLIAMMLTLALLLAACAPAKPAPTVTPLVTDVPVAEAAPAEEAQSVQLSLEKLAAFNGKDGARAYVAVDGVIYDVTDSAFWKNGSHNGFEAGQDLTQAIKEKSPHGIAKLDNVVKIGEVKE